MPRGWQAPATVPSASGRFRVVPIGLCEDYPEQSRTLDDARADLELLRRVGVRVLRVSIGWDEIEPEKDRYNFEFWDQFVAMATDEYGVRLIPYVAYTPSWNAAGPHQTRWKSPPRDVREFEEVMALLARRYAERIDSWEIWNEPDNRDYWLGTREQFVALLRAGAAGVRRVLPQAQTVLGGIAGDLAYLEQLLRDGVAAHVDVVNVHAYFETWNAAPIERLPGYLADAAKLVTRLGSGERLWLAEVGYGSYRKGAEISASVRAFCPYEHTARFQADVLVRTVALALAESALHLLAWYEVRDLATGAPVIGDENNRHLGVLLPDRRAKPAREALRLMVELFARGFRNADVHVRMVRHSGSEVTSRAFQLTDGRLVVIAWIPTRPIGEGPQPCANGVDSRRAELTVVLPGTAAPESGFVLDAVGASEPLIDPLILHGGQTAILIVPSRANLD